MPRLRLNLNRDWRFIRDDVSEARDPGFDDSSWQRVGLPHCFDLPYFRTPEFYVGVGWYRRGIEIQPDWTSQRLFLEFDGAFQKTEVFVNGLPVGSHAGGYTSFLIDITDAIRAGDNLVAVRVDNRWNAQLAPRAGEHHFSGGLYRDIHLIVVDALHLTWRGVQFDTVKTDAGAIQVRSRVALRNSSDRPRFFDLEATLLDPFGRFVARGNHSGSVSAQGEREIEWTFESIADVRLWSPRSPARYSLDISVKEEGQTVDRVIEPFGIRTFEWTPDRGFFLNGEHLYLHGANVHQDHAGWGVGITQSAIRRDIQLMKDCGFNFVRGAHYPHHRAFAQACDEIGMICLPENCFWGKGGFGPEGYWNASAYPIEEQDWKPFEESCKQSLRELIRDNRNSPSVVAWSMTNEAFFTFHLDRAKRLMRELVELSHKLDSTRPAAIGGAQRGDVDHLGDIAAYNGDGAKLFIDPGIPNLVSEYGALSKPHVAFEPFFGDLQEEKFAWRAGEAIWCGFDYGTIAGKQGLKGIVDHFRLPKQSWYWYRHKNKGIGPQPWPSEGVPATMLLRSEGENRIEGTGAIEDVQLILTLHDADSRCVGNCPTVTLAIEKGPGEFPTGRSITFDPSTDIQIVGGRAAIAFRSYHGGTTFIRATSPGLQDTTIQIETFGEPQWVEGESVPCEDRPYLPPKPSAAALAALNSVVNVARDRPARASSFEVSHPPRLANDADADSFWLASNNDALASWTLDLEGFYELAGDKLTFPDSGNYRYVIELSRDGKDWIVGMDRTQTVNESNVRTNVYDPGTISRYVRVRFTKIPSGARAGIAECEVFGILSTR